MVLLLALLLAFSVWLIHKLSLEYNVYLNAEVVAVSNIKDHSNYSKSGVKVMARCRTTGWRILYSHLKDEEVVYLHLPSNVMIQDAEDEDRYYITTETLHEYADDIFGSNVSVNNFVSEKVYFDFQKEICKTVPIKPVSSLSFDDQYVATSKLEIVPAYVDVYGDEVHLSELEYVTTNTIKHSSIDESINGMISLSPIPGMRFSVDEVHYKMDVVRYVEIERRNVPIEIKNLPRGNKSTYVTDPAAVDVLLECEFPLKANLKSNTEYDLRLFVDYRDLKESISGYVPVHVDTIPRGTINYDLSQSFVKIMEVSREW